jgi:hypothetical protein
MHGSCHSFFGAFRERSQPICKATGPPAVRSWDSTSHYREQTGVKETLAGDPVAFLSPGIRTRLPVTTATQAVLTAPES